MDTLAHVCEHIASHNRRARKVSILTEYLRTLDAADLHRAVRFLSGSPLAAPDLFGESRARPLSVGSATVRKAIIAAAGWDPAIVRICAEQVGDAGETVALLMHARTEAQPLSLAAAESWYIALSTAAGAGAKAHILEHVFRTCRPLAIKYFTRILAGNLRIGLGPGMVEQALSAIRGETGLFHPIEFMLAQSIDSAAAVPDAAAWIVEDKYKGPRCQLHFAHGRVALYGRRMDEITADWPAVAAQFAALNASGVLDGQLENGAFIAYDILSLNGASLHGHRLEHRRQLLESLGVTVSPAQSPAGAACIERLFHAARTRGREGVVLKRRDSLYQPGTRGADWRKLTLPFTTLLVAITAAAQGRGANATLLSEYTIGVRSGAGWVNVGKVESTLPAADTRELTRVLRASAIEKFGRAVLVAPQVILEVAFESVRESPRHKGGFALCSPRILGWRKDRKIEDCDDIERIRTLHESP